jgi:hypothetical protein
MALKIRDLKVNPDLAPLDAAQNMIDNAGLLGLAEGPRFAMAIRATRLVRASIEIP